MGREKKKLAGGGGSAKDRHHRRVPRAQFNPRAPMPTGFEAKPTVHRSKSRHHTYFEFVENADKKKKKLEFQVTTKATPPPGFEFVPIGNPALMTACKELSREKGAMIFIVSNTKEIDPNHLSHHVHRTGHHIREAIVDEARASLEHLPDGGVQANDGIPEPLPATQEEYTTQANAAILDLFPRIPHTDRQSIIAHAFNLASINQRPKPVGLCTDITLSRRAQLAVLAHIRHTHTRYDHLLKETTWQNARKVVESLCLDILVKWRGDEETGRDQLDEILREVVVISDSDSGESDDEDEEDDTEDSSIDEVMNPDQPTGPDHPYMGSWQGRPPREQPPSGRIQPPQSLQAPLPVIPGRGDRHMAIPQPTTGRKEQRGFKRYRAWEEAIRRNRDEDDDEDDDDDPRQPPPQHMLDNAVSSGPWTSYHSPVNAVPRLAAAGPAMGGVGNVPGSNGFVQPRPYTSLAPPASPPARNPGGDNVTLYPAEHRRTLVPSGQPHYNHAPPTTMMMDGLQDMLVPSIEPASPEAAMPPSFVRTLPPRKYPSAAAGPAPFRLPSASPPASPSKETGTRDRPYHIIEETSVIGRIDHPPLSQWHHRSSHGFRQDMPARYHDPNILEPTYHRPMAVEPHPHPPQQPGTISAVPLPQQRAPVGAGRPRPQPSQFRMEDRGGFLEKVHEPVDEYTGVSIPGQRPPPFPGVAHRHWTPPPPQLDAYAERYYPPQRPLQNANVPMPVHWHEQARFGQRLPPPLPPPPRQEFIAVPVQPRPEAMYIDPPPPPPPEVHQQQPAGHYYPHTEGDREYYYRGRRQEGPLPNGGSHIVVLE